MGQTNKKVVLRDRTIDAIKGFCILWVAFGHSGNDGGIANTIISTFYMSAFFIFSGYLFKYKTDKVKDTVFYKIKTLYPLYLLWAIIPCMTLMIQSLIAGQPAPFNTLTLPFKIFLCIDLPSIIGQLWFIVALLTTELLWIVIDNIFKKQKTKFICLCTLAALGLLLNYCNIQLPILRLGTALIMLPIFYIGVQIKRHEVINNITTKNLRWLICGITIYGISAFLQIKIFGYKISIFGNNYGIYPLFYINAILGTFIFFAFTKAASSIHNKIIKIPLSILSFYGENSAILLVTMNFLIYLAQRILSALPIANISFWSFLIVVLLQIPLSKMLKSRFGRVLLCKY